MAQVMPAPWLLTNKNRVSGQKAGDGQVDRPIQKVLFGRWGIAQQGNGDDSARETFGHIAGANNSREQSRRVGELGGQSAGDVHAASQAEDSAAPEPPRPPPISCSVFCKDSRSMDSIGTLVKAPMRFSSIR